MGDIICGDCQILRKTLTEFIQRREKALKVYDEGKGEHILELYHPQQSDWKIEINISKYNIGKCQSCAMESLDNSPKILPFIHKIIKGDFSTINQINEHCFYHVDNMLRELETLKNGITVKNPEVLKSLRGELNSLQK